MSRTTFRLILLVSCAHALVHVFELALPSVEQMIGAEFHVGTKQTGLLGTVWRIPFGVGAVFTGWLVDRYGSKRLLLIYLAGCSAMCLIAGVARTFDGVFVAMLCMGCFASIYHPAGLALISHETTPETRGAALGWHGIFGSIGIAGAPFLAGIVFASGEVTWREYYMALAIPGLALMLLMAFRLRETHPVHRQDETNRTVTAATHQDQGNWRRYSILLITGVLSGFIYAAFMHFLPRYLDDAGFSVAGVSAAGLRNRLAALVLACGIVGQSVAGKFAKPGRLEWGLTVILFANAPLLLWMAFASGHARVAATCLLALVHFMNQPFYNSLIAEYVTARRRSLGYGFSNMVCFSLGGLGPTFAGFIKSDEWTYGGLAIVAALGGCVSLVLAMSRSRQ
ncbi:MAG: MFS transporter [Planctomycetaceae bacterium]|nr:MFS transporter [Planctomycetaceae bacterium]